MDLTHNLRLAAKCETLQRTTTLSEHRQCQDFVFNLHNRLASFLVSLVFSYIYDARPVAANETDTKTSELHSWCELQTSTVTAEPP